MSSSGSGNNSERRDDFTSIENLGEFLHQEDPEVDEILNAKSTPSKQSEKTEESVEIEKNEEEVEAFHESNEVEVISSETPLESESENENENEPELKNESEEISEAPTNNETDSEFATGQEFETNQESSFEVDESSDFHLEEQADPNSEDFSHDTSSTDFASSEEMQPDQTIIQEEQVAQAAVDKSDQFNFSDVKEFAENIKPAAEILHSIASPQGPFVPNPPYAIILKGIQNQQQIDTIIGQLSEFEYLNDSNRQNILESLEQGQILITQISEFLAINLVIALRHLNLEMEFGLVDEIRPMKKSAATEEKNKNFLDQNPKGISSKKSLLSNRSYFYEYLDRKPVNINQIQVSQTSQLENYQIEFHIGPLTAQMTIPDQFVQDRTMPIESSEQTLQMSHYYDMLIEEIKLKALKMKANAIVGVNFQLFPLKQNQNNESELLYLLTAQGNGVWVEPIK